MMTAERFARGMTFDAYVALIGSPENLAREGVDVRRGGRGVVQPRPDWSGYLRERHARARLTESQRAAITWLAAQPHGPAKILVIAEDWSSDCRRDLPYLARLAEAGGLELRIFLRDGEKMVMRGLPNPADSPNADLVAAYGNEKNGEWFASIPVAVFYAADFDELHRYVEYPAIYHKDRVYGHFRAARPGETADATRARAGTQIGALFESPFFDVWAEAAIDEIVSALHEKVVMGGQDA